eukprot:TRINITY_DN31795_c0_g1_i1.p1 TRINITY_DN31795_c0_g1~~TRINITY_DN31795_c0_g1_i1.p1  ORF type:complete len:737 (+),score=154.34 TRINITY_DN31795_c0_g1_i1:90-2300(+)
MSDDEADDSGVVARDSYGGEDGEGGGEAGPLHPCCAWCIGLVCLVASVVLLFKNEGQYVQTMAAIEATRQAVVRVCDPGCARCDFNTVVEVVSGKPRPLRSGDVVWLACDLHNLRGVGDVVGSGFLPAELKEALRAEGDAEAQQEQSAARFTWTTEMYQNTYEKGTHKSPNLVNFKNGKYKHDRHAYCKDPDVLKEIYGKTCAPTLPKSKWKQIQAPTPTSFIALNEPQTATDNHGIAPSSPAVPETPLDDSMGHSVAEPITPEGPQSNLRRLANKKKDEQQEHPIHVSCDVEMCTFKEKWLSSNFGGGFPDTWQRLPTRQDQLAYAQPPAQNLPSLGSGESDFVKRPGGAAIRLGALKDTQNSFSIDQLADKARLFPDYEPVRLARRSPAQTFNAVGNKVSTKYSTDADGRQATITIHRYDRSKSMWTAENSAVSDTDACPLGCICSSDMAAEVGDLRTCIKRSTTKSIAIIAGAMKTSSGWALVETDTLKTKQGSLTEGSGFRKRINSASSAEELLDDAQHEADSLLFILHVAMPLVMWIGFYCCLSPIVWVLDQCGDCLEQVPCFGGLLGAVMGCMETLAAVMICFVGGIAAASVSLFVVAFAWLWFRPLYGICLLAAASLLLALLIYISMNRKGGARAASRRRFPPQQQQQYPQAPQVELSGAPVAFAAQPAQPQMAVATAVAVPAPQQFQVACPPGVAPGAQLHVQTPDGRLVMVQVPAGVMGGQQFLVTA